MGKQGPGSKILNLSFNLLAVYSPIFALRVLKLVIVLQVLLRIRGRSWLWSPVQLLRATLVGRRASVLVSPISHFRLHFCSKYLPNSLVLLNVINLQKCSRAITSALG